MKDYMKAICEAREGGVPSPSRMTATLLRFGTKYETCIAPLPNYGTFVAKEPQRQNSTLIVLDLVGNINTF